MGLQEYLRMAVEKRASDIYIGAGHKLSFKINGLFVHQGDEIIGSGDAERMVTSLYEMANRTMEHFRGTGDDDFSISIPGMARLRVSVCLQQGTMVAFIRVVTLSIPNYQELGISAEVMGTAHAKNGLVLVTGQAGSGKTTTLACILDNVNKSRNCHIVTLEDPIEYLHTDNKSIITQREVSADTLSYVAALRATLRHVPDIILLGEMRDLETMRTAMTAAETGHLVISTLHTSGAVNTIDRIIDVFPPEQQQQIRVQLSMVLRTVVSQKLLPGKDGRLIPAFEILHTNNAVQTLIREGKTHQINTLIQTSSNEGMITMDSSMLKLYKEGHITSKTIIDHASDPDQMAVRLKEMA